MQTPVAITVNGTTRGLTQGGFSWKGPTGHCRGPTSQHSEKNEKWWWIRMWMAMV